MNPIEKLARLARKEFENKSLNKEQLAKLYLNYNNINDIDKFISTALKQFPVLNCGLASVYLKNKIGGDIINGKFRGNDHTFVTINNNILDITADQFGGPAVYFGPLINPWEVKDEKIKINN